MAEDKSFMDYLKAAAHWVGENVMPDVYAKVRQGAKEFEQVIPAFPDSIRTIDEPGTLGCPTQLSVNLENGTYDEWQESKQRAASPPQLERQAELEL